MITNCADCADVVDYGYFNFTCYQLPPFLLTFTLSDDSTSFLALFLLVVPPQQLVVRIVVDEMKSEGNNLF